MQCETVKIKTDNADGYRLINAEDFDESVHELFDDQQVSQEDEQPVKRGKK